MSAKIMIITGATGFIGRFLVEEGLKSGYQVVAWGRDESHSEGLPDQVELIRPGFSDFKKMSDALRYIKSNYGVIDLFVHNAGLTKSLRWDRYMEVNANNTFRLTEVMRLSHHEPGRFILMSSLAAVGPGDPATMKPISPFDEPNPNTQYGKSKLKAEQIVRNSGLNWTIIRPTGVYGPRDKDYLVMFQSVKKGIATSIGFRPHYISFAYVKDLAQAVMLAAESPHERQIFHISDGNTYTQREFRDLVSKIVNPYAVRLSVPEAILQLATTLAEFMGQIQNTAPTLNCDKYHTLVAVNWKCDISLTKELLGYAPQYDLRKGLEETYLWYKEAHWI